MNQDYTKINDNLLLINNIKFEDKQYIKKLSEFNFVIFPHEWETNKAQILSHFNSYNNELTKIHARKCEVNLIEMNELRKFCDLYHIQKSNRLGIIGWGIYYNNELMGVLSLGKHHRQNSEEIILDRLCFKSNIRINGGASKLFNSAIKWAKEQLKINEIISYSDNRLSKGNVYEKLNFKLDKELKPDYFYLNKNNPLIYKSKQSQKKSNTNCPNEKTEKEFCKEKDLFQVYDAGKKRWKFEIKKEYNSNNPIKFRKKGYYSSSKAGTIYYQSSYELRAAYLLDKDNEVESYSTQVMFFNKSNKKRYIDFLVKYKNNSYTIIEVKPERRLIEFKDQIDDNIEYANKNKWNFSVWTEKELKLKSEHYILKWANQFIDSTQSVNLVEEKKIKNRKSSKKYYDNFLLTNKVKVYCNFCNAVHEVLKNSYNKNIEKNGQYICEKHGGFIAGSRPKPHLIKINPYEHEGRKECTKCKEIKEFNCFWKDKSKRDGYAGQCMICKNNKIKNSKS
jgi:predicted GNAT family N-acyltransferase